MNVETQWMEGTPQAFKEYLSLRRFNCLEHHWPRSEQLDSFIHTVA